MYLNNKQSFIFAVVLLLFISFAACEKSSLSINSSEFGQSITLKPNDELFLSTSNSSSLKFLVKSIFDSRCPINAQCIAAGNAKVILNVSQGGQTTDLTLNFGDQSKFKPDTLNFSINNGNYQAILLDVNPYPNLGKESGDKSATFVINKR